MHKLIEEVPIVSLGDEWELLDEMWQPVAVHSENSLNLIERPTEVPVGENESTSSMLDELLLELFPIENSS